LARLASSTGELFGQEPPPAARELVNGQARTLALGRLRLDVIPDPAGGLAATVKVAPVDPALVFPSWERATTLAAIVVRGGIGAHKWSDRRLLDQAQSDCGEALPLVLDEDGAVLEVSRGNVFLVRDGSLVTPVTDGRLLPGVARRRVMEAAADAGIETHEEVVSHDQLSDADEVFVSGSVRGVEPVGVYASVRRWEEGAVTGVISTSLRRMWLGEQRPGLDST
jgi:para-aminobenzoate synthetase / 4-amino-4-deoxychorismate lyase